VRVALRRAVWQDMGRFTQQDPIGLAGGLNLYGYAGSDPINFSDPFGLCPVCEIASAGMTSMMSAPLPNSVNRGGYVLSNPEVKLNVLKLYNALASHHDTPGFEFQVTGGDRHHHTITVESPPGDVSTLVEIRSSTNNSVVKGASRTSPHLVSRGARAADLRIKGVSNTIVDAATANSTGFAPGNTERDYPEAPHTHVALPPKRRSP